MIESPMTASVARVGEASKVRCDEHGPGGLRQRGVMRETPNWPEGREFETLPTMTRLTLNAQTHWTNFAS